MILSGREIAWYMETGKLKITPVEEMQFQQNGIDLVLESVETAPYEFHKGEFYLGCTKEVLELPDDLMAFVELRSTWARTGLMVPPTIVDAGFRGNLTLEIASFANVPVPYHKRFAHLIFAKLTSPSIPYNGKYQDQRGVTKPIKDGV
jgi:dCTP deaminase